jgi:SAM-dependent methyltransferase
MTQFLQIVGEVSGLTVLDAGCGEGYLSRILMHRGAHVTGIDISPRLVEMVRAKDPAGNITYQVADLSQPLTGSLLVRRMLTEFQQQLYLVYTPAYDPDANRIEWHRPRLAKDRDT